MQAQPRFDTNDRLHLAVARPPEPLKRARILIVDDDTAVRVTLSRILQRAGAMVLGASSPSEAVAVLEAARGDIDLAIIDVVLPEMSGPECAERLVDVSPTISIAYVSAHFNPGVCSSDTASESGVELRVGKPFSGEALVHAVLAVIERRAPRRSVIAPTVLRAS